MRVFPHALGALLLLFSLPSHAENGMEQQAANIRSLVSDLSCKEDAHCKSIGIGSRACGGYEEFLVYSTLKADEKILQDKVQHYNAFQAKYNDETGMASICSVEEPKPVNCKNDFCKVTD